MSRSAAAIAGEKPISALPGRARRRALATPDVGDARRALSAMTSSMKRVMTRRTSSWMTRGRSRPGCSALDLVEQRGDERDDADRREIEQAGAQAVVDVVRVIGDVVGDRRRLRLEAGEVGEIEALRR